MRASDTATSADLADTELPEGWATSSLDALIGPDGLFTDGDWVESKDQDPAGDVRLIQLADIGDGDYRNRSARYLTSAKAAELRCTYLQAGDVLVARMPDPLGRACVFPGDTKPAVTAVDVCILRPGKNGADARWLMRTINAPQFRGAMEEFERGTTRKRISRRNLASIELPLPPLAEQQRTVAQVEALLARLNAARERLAKVPVILKRFRQAVLAAACSGRLTEEWRPAGAGEWMSVPLREVVESLDQGWSPKCKIEAAPSPEVWAVIKTTAVQPLWFDERENKRLPEGLDPRPELEVKPGDLLITRAGPRARAGVTCLVRAVRPRLMICDKAYRFRLRAAAALGEFVNLVLNEPSVLQEIDSMKTGISDSGVNLTQSKFLDLQMPLPALEEQHEIVRRVDALFKLADGVEQRVKAATARAEKLTQAILAKAFRGELVPTEAELARREGRDYEPAAVLLERVRAERAAHDKPTATTEIARRNRVGRRKK